MESPRVRSLLDTDMYKLTMQAAVLQHYPHVRVSYRFYNRDKSKILSKSAYEWLRDQVASLSDLSVTEDEITFLRNRCPYLPDEYLLYLRKLRLHPENEIMMSFDEKTRELSILIEGLWVQTILYEIPLLSMISEAYFRFVDTDWSYEGQFELAAHKAEQLFNAGCAFSEFGTRRRRDYHTQDIVLQGLLSVSGLESCKGRLVGTSNVHFAQKYALRAIGTIAHEWFMGTAAITNDYLRANEFALIKWRDTYGDELGIALTDTFGTNIFLQNFTSELARKYAGVRQDSGSPEAFARRMVQFYQARGIDPSTKSIVFSDGLDIEKCVALERLSNELGIGCSFGIGTFLTNDFRAVISGDKSAAMSIVIKLASAGGAPAIKISDEMGKHTGDLDLLGKIQELLKQAELK